MLLALQMDFTIRYRLFFDYAIKYLRKLINNKEYLCKFGDR